MEQKILIVVTRLRGSEFTNYWRFTSVLVSNTDLQYTKPIIKDIGSNKIIFFNGQLFPEVAYTDNYLKKIFELERLNDVLTNRKIGIISHKGSEPFPTSFIGYNTEIIFNQKYSSSQGLNFCQYFNDDFVVPLSEPDTTRNGILDKFRDALIYNQSSVLGDAFENIWEYFEKRKNPNFNIALDFLQKFPQRDQNEIPELPSEIALHFGQTMYLGKDDNCSVGVRYENWKNDPRKENLALLADVVLDWAGYNN